MRQLIRAGTVVADSDTGEQFAQKINDMTEELYEAKHTHGNMNILNQLTPEKLAWLESIDGIFDEETAGQFSVLLRDLQDALQSIARIYPGANLTVKFQTEISAAPFSGNPWAWIQSRIRAENFIGILPGDFIPLEVAGNTYNMEVAGINTYANYGRSAEWVPSHIDFISRELWPDTILWNLVNYNNGLASMTTPFLTSNVNAFLNSLQTNVPNGITASPETVSVDYRSSGILNQIPTEVRNVIIPKVAAMGRRFSTNIILVDDNAVDWRIMGDLWLPTEIEVHGCRQWSGNLSPNQGFSSGGYLQYPIFASSMKRIKRNAGTGSRSTWWLASPNGGDSFRGTAIGSTGIATRYGAGTGNHRVPICFRVA